ncbi:unnamed protein product [Periconia digitata]|uniref:Uncharacterized protein n=1 Tax=Periconia digitata TaxID=1303443 RepID=A0A9W4UAM5_9PLEO|nr:unnamed protein product [Periconia digitata]
MRYIYNLAHNFRCHRRCDGRCPATTATVGHVMYMYHGKGSALVPRQLSFTRGMLGFGNVHSSSALLRLRREALLLISSKSRTTLPVLN